MRIYFFAEGTCQVMCSFSTLHQRLLKPVNGRRTASNSTVNRSSRGRQPGPCSNVWKPSIELSEQSLAFTKSFVSGQHHAG